MPGPRTPRLRRAARRNRRETTKETDVKSSADRERSMRNAVAAVLRANVCKVGSGCARDYICMHWQHGDVAAARGPHGRWRDRAYSARTSGLCMRLADRPVEWRGQCRPPHAIVGPEYATQAIAGAAPQLTLMVMMAMVRMAVGCRRRATCVVAATRAGAT